MYIKYFSPKKIILISKDKKETILYAPKNCEFDLDIIEKIWEDVE